MQIQSINFQGIYGKAYRKDDSGKKIEIPIDLTSDYSELVVWNSPEKNQKQVRFTNDKNCMQPLENNDIFYDDIKIDKADKNSKLNLYCNDQVLIKSLSDKAYLRQYYECRSDIERVEGQDVSIELADKSKTHINKAEPFNLYTPKIYGFPAKVSGGDLNISA